MNEIWIEIKDYQLKKIINKDIASLETLINKLKEQYDEIENLKKEKENNNE